MALVAESTGEMEAIDKIKVGIEKTITKLKGSILSVDEWGERSLVQKINKHDRGYYLIYQVELVPNSVKKLKNLLIQDKQILRVLLLSQKAQTIH